MFSATRIFVAFLLKPLASTAAELSLSSPDVAAGATIGGKYVYNGYGCKGGNVSPALEWKNPPVGTKSFALSVFDPDAPTGHGWLHWLVVNIPAATHALPRNAGSADNKNLPAGSLQIKTDFGAPGYGGPCPPKGHGVHHYVFTLSALGVEKLELPADAAKANAQIEAQHLGQASFTAIYQR